MMVYHAMRIFGASSVVKLPELSLEAGDEEEGPVEVREDDDDDDEEDYDGEISDVELEMFPAPEACSAYPRVSTSLNGHFRVYDRVIVVDLSSSDLRAIPKSILRIKQLQELNLTRNKIQDLPDGLGRMKHLRYLYLGENRLRTLPPVLFKLPRLIVLDLLSNPIEELPEFPINLWRRMESLQLSDTKLKTIPKSIANIADLKDLRLSDCRLETVPETLGEMKCLVYLSMENNRLKELPERLGRCRRLRVLKVGRNRLKSIPGSLARNRLLAVVASNNPFDEVNKDDLPNNPLSLRHIASNAVIDEALRVRGRDVPATVMTDLRSWSNCDTYDCRGNTFDGSHYSLTCFVADKIVDPAPVVYKKRICHPTCSDERPKTPSWLWRSLGMPRRLLERDRWPLENLLS